MNTNVLLSSLLAPAVVLTASAELTEIDTKFGGNWGDDSNGHSYRSE